MSVRSHTRAQTVVLQSRANGLIESYTYDAEGGRLSDDEKQQLGSPMGPQNPQSLNRYSYVLNSPMRWTDPSGHDSCDTGPGCGGVVYNHTNHPIWVVGSVMGACPGGTGKICENVLVEIPPGKSSADMGVADADAVVTGPGDGNSVVGGKLTNHEQATVTDSRGGLSIAFEAKPGSTAAEVGGERAYRCIQDAGIIGCLSGKWERSRYWPVEYVQGSDGKMRRSHSS